MDSVFAGNASRGVFGVKELATGKSLPKTRHYQLGIEAPC